MAAQRSEMQSCRTQVKNQSTHVDFLALSLARSGGSGCNAVLAGYPVGNSSMIFLKKVCVVLFTGGDTDTARHEHTSSSAYLRRRYLSTTCQDPLRREFGYCAQTDAGRAVLDVT